MQVPQAIVMSLSVRLDASKVGGLTDQLIDHSLSPRWLGLDKRCKQHEVFSISQTQDLDDCFPKQHGHNVLSTLQWGACVKSSRACLRRCACTQVLTGWSSSVILRRERGRWKLVLLPVEFNSVQDPISSSSVNPMTFPNVAFSPSFFNSHLPSFFSSLFFFFLLLEFVFSFFRLPGESHRRRLRSLLLYLCPP